MIIYIVMIDRSTTDAQHEKSTKFDPNVIELDYEVLSLFVLFFFFLIA